MNNQTPIFSIVGSSNSGKTTLIIKLIKELKSRGYCVGAIKHTHHEPSFDRRGKDSWMHTQAGADTAIVASKKIVGITRKTSEEMQLLEIIKMYLKDADIIVVEGYKSEPLPKIEVFRTVNNGELVCKNDKNLIAVIGDHDPSIGKPFIHIDANPSLIVDLLLSLLGRKSTS
ncbi:MAG: molybdopterin-guanine dinucleotide biosynthesis protein B [Candidatus Brocadiaceae bacterium]|nr:molybdopterin-guanine dinucleotide biosynthesis protein B [Candidatus Brocadiaceae bacterium]